MALQRIITARGIIFKDGKLFLQKLNTDNGANTFWSTPGGKLDPGEAITDCVVRELIEETGVAPKLGRLLFVQQFNDGEREFEEFFFHIENPDDYEMINLSSTSHGELEVAEYGFVDPTIEPILPAFIGQLDIQSYIDIVRPVYFYSELSNGIKIN